MTATRSERRGTILVFAKPPRPHQVKTRLAKRIGAERAAELAQCFLKDTWSQLCTIRWARVVIATTEPDAPELAFAQNTWDQGDGDLGARIERGVARALSEAPFAIALGADTPGLPLDLLERARSGLAAHDAVIGPCADGGFYLLGLRQCPQGLLRGIPWSGATTERATCAALTRADMTPVKLPRWFDVDEPTDLHRLQRELTLRRLHAPLTRRWLATNHKRLLDEDICHHSDAE